jgi:hypothetical protein
MIKRESGDNRGKLTQKSQKELSRMANQMSNNFYGPNNKSRLMMGDDPSKQYKANILAVLKAPRTKAGDTSKVNPINGPIAGSHKGAGK